MHLESAIGRLTGPPYEYLGKLTVFIWIIRVVSRVACHEKSDGQQKKYVRCLQSVIGRFTGFPYEYLTQLTVFICKIRVVSGVQK